MAEDGQLARIAHGRSTEPSLSDLLDPAALDERLKEARARRAEALSRRPAAPAPPPAPDPAPARPAAPRLAAATVPILIFLAGLGLGGAAVAVLALRSLPARVAATADFAPAPAPRIAPAAAPVVAASPPAVATAPPDAAPALALPSPRPAAAPATRAPALLAAPARDAAPSPASALPRLAAAPPPATPTPALPPRVFIHYPASAAEAAAAARDALTAAGVPEVEIIPVRYAIGQSNIRYYHDGDREPAAALAPLLAASIGGAPSARDFTGYATPAAPGNVEVWLAGAPSAARASARPVAARTDARGPRRAPAVRAASPDTPFQMPGVIAPPVTQAEKVERILIERLRQDR